MNWRTTYRKDHIYNSAYYSDIYNGPLCWRTALFCTGKKRTFVVDYERDMYRPICANHFLNNITIMNSLMLR